MVPTPLIHGNRDCIVLIERPVSLAAKMDSLQIEYAFAGALKVQKDSIQNWEFDFIVERYHSCN